MNQPRQALTVELLNRELELEAGEVGRLCGVSREVVIEWIEEGVAEPLDRERWRFSGHQIRRLRTAGRLQRDFDLDTSTLPLILDLVEEVEHLRRRVRVLQRLVD